MERVRGKERERERGRVWKAGETCISVSSPTHFFLSLSPLPQSLHYFNYKHSIGESSYFSADDVLPRALNKYFHFFFIFLCFHHRDKESFIWRGRGGGERRLFFPSAESCHKHYINTSSCFFFFHELFSCILGRGYRAVSPATSSPLTSF